MRNLMLSFAVVLALLVQLTSKAFGDWTKAGSFRIGAARCFVRSGTNVFAGMEEAGIFLSTNEGASWTAVNIGLTNIHVRGLAVGPASGEGDDRPIFAATQGGVFVSTNFGGNWTPKNAGLPRLETMCIAASDSSVFVGVAYNAVYRSTDNGTSWTAANAGIQSYFSMIYSLVVVPDLGETGKGTLFAGTFLNGVYRSTDNGTTWTFSGLDGDWVTSLAVGPFPAETGGSAIYAALGWDDGAARSTDNGISWTNISSGLPPPIYEAMVHGFAVSGTNLFVGTEGGVYRSKDSGTSWEAVNNGLTDTIVYCIAATKSTLLVGTRLGGAFVSSDSGAQWTPANAGLMPYATSIVASPYQSSALYAGTTTGGLFISQDSGASWWGPDTGFYALNVTSIVANETGIFFGTWGHGVRKGYQWVNNGLTNTNVTSLLLSGNNLYAGTYKSGVFRTTNSGTQWTAANTGIANAAIWSLVLCGKNLFACAGVDGVFLSSDSATTWSPVSTGLVLTDVRCLAVCDTILFAGTRGNGVFVSADDGAHWTAPNIGLTSLDVFSLVASGNVVFAGTAGGVFESTDGGARWIPVNAGLSDLEVRALACPGNYLYAGTNNSALWRRPLAEMFTSVRPALNGLPEVATLEQNYPNPFNPSTQINYSIPKATNVTLKVYDVLGREIATLVNERKQSGAYKVTWNAEGVPTGVYFYRIVAGEFIETKKMVLIR